MGLGARLVTLAVAAFAVGLAVALAGPPVEADVRLARPSGLEGERRADGSVVLRWRDRARGETRYVVERRARGRWRRVASRRADARRAHLRRTTARTARFRVRACRRRTCSRPSRSVRVPAAASRPDPTGGPRLAGCPVFPADHPLNRDVSRLPVHPRSRAWVAWANRDAETLHADFGGRGRYGIPFVTVPEDEPRIPVNFTAYGDESDPGPYPVPLDAPIEGGRDSDGDRHVLALQRGTCRAYELYRAFPRGDRWDADSGAVFDLRSARLRPEGWTSADAAGLSVLAGLVRYDEVAAGRVEHAIRFTVRTVQRAWMHPATHYGTTDDPDAPPYGARFRLRADFDLSRFRGQARVILEALKRYGLVLADQGTSWYLTGDADPRWDDDDLRQLADVPGSAFEVVDTGERIRRPD